MAWWLGFGVFTAETQVQALVGGPCYLSRGKAKNTKRKKLYIIISVNGHPNHFKMQMLIEICSGDNHKSPTDSVVIEKSLD